MEVSESVQPNSKFWDRIAKRYAKSAIKDEAAYQQKLNITQQYLEPHHRVLEVGCGTGGTALALAPFIEHMTATDISSAMLSYGEEKLAATGLSNVDFRQGSVEQISEQVGGDEQKFDVLCAFSLIHLLDNPDSFYAHVQKLLKPGGFFVTSTACLQDHLAWLKYVLPLGRMMGLVPNVRFLTEESLLQEIKNQNFTVEHHWRPQPNAGVFVVAQYHPSSS